MNGPGADSPEAALAALYAAVSFTPGGRPDWEKMGALFHPGGRLVPMRREAAQPAATLDVAGFRARFEAADARLGLSAKGFYESEACRTIQRYGAIAQVFSAYESRYAKDDPAPWDRGVNSIQLVREDGRWFVLTVLWDSEANGAGPVPGQSA